MTALPTRAEYVAGLRAIADLIESTPELPLPKWSAGLTGSLGSVGGAPAVAGAALALGAPFMTEVVGNDIHYRAERAFGPVEFGLSYVEFGAAKSIPGAGGKVADSDVGPASATAPAETAVGASVAPADGEPPLSGTPAAAPAPVVTGDGAAVTPDVWVPIRRRGTNYHRPGGQRSTACGRNTFPNGVRLREAEALDFGAVPCPRCYGGAA